MEVHLRVGILKLFLPVLLLLLLTHACNWPKMAKIKNNNTAFCPFKVKTEQLERAAGVVVRSFR